MVNVPFTSYTVEDRSFAAFIKRELHHLVRDHFSPIRIGEIDIVVSEILSNLIKFTGSGELLYRLTKDTGSAVLELLCIDSGPGIKDLPSMMKDGSSTTHTLGQGLGAITRLANFSQIYSRTGWGTIVYVQFTSNDASDVPERQQRKVSICALCLPKPGEKFCGDGFYTDEKAGIVKVFLGDGLGHGVQASEAVQLAIRSLVRHPQLHDPAEMLRQIHTDTKKSRGLVGTVAVIDLNGKTMEACGVGNIALRIQSGTEVRNHSPYNGILGMNVPNTINNTSFRMDQYQTIVLTSDGIKTRWDFSQYGNILKYDPIIIAAAIYKDHARRTDDMSVAVIRIK